jgi:23S rRNA maturation mini-RNase III
MLQHAINTSSGSVEPFFDIVKMKAEEADAYPSENYDWERSGLYKQILERYNKNKEAVAERIKNPRSSKRKNNGGVEEYMDDPGYRAALNIILLHGDAVEV